MRYGKSKDIKEVLENYIKAFKLSDKLNEVKLNECWEKLMGVSIAKHTTKIEIRKNKLYIFLDSAALRNELSYAKQKIAAAINDELKSKVIDEVILI